jgi:peptidylprolyl isomerase
VVLPRVSGAFGAKAAPSVHFSSSGPPSTLKVVVLHQGNGPVVKKNQLLVANYLGQIWNGKVFDSSFSRHLASAFPIGVGRVIPGWDKALVGEHAGSRLLLVVPPSDGYGPKGQPSAGIPGNATLVFVVDLISSYSSSATALHTTATLHATANGVTVTWPSKGMPSVKVSKTYVAPKTPTVTVISRGTGHKVAPGLVVLQYIVVDTKTGKVVDSTWHTGYPDGENAGIKATPSSIDKFLGLPVGTRALLRLPATSSGGPYVLAVEIVAQPSVLK